MFSYYEHPEIFSGHKICFLDGDDIWVSTEKISREMIQDIRVSTGLDLSTNSIYFKILNPIKADHNMIDHIISKLSNDVSIKEKIIELRMNIRDKKISKIFQDN